MGVTKLMTSQLDLAKAANLDVKVRPCWPDVLRQMNSFFIAENYTHWRVFKLTITCECLEAKAGQIQTGNGNFCETRSTAKSRLAVSIPTLLGTGLSTYK
jgi:hypothetical protein